MTPRNLVPACLMSGPFQSANRYAAMALFACLLAPGAYATVPTAHCQSAGALDASPDLSVFEEFHISQFVRVESRLPGYREGTFGSLEPGEGGPPAPNIRAVGDLNNDGIDDLVIEYIETGVEPVIMTGSADGVFTRLPFSDPAAARRHVRNAELVDMNNDGFLDFVGFTTGDHVEVFKRHGTVLTPGEDNLLLLNQAGKSFRPVALPSLAENEVQHGGTVADFDGDGFPDIVGLNEEDGAPSKVIRNVDGHTFAFAGSALSPEVTEYWIHDGDAGDLDGDGFQDIVISIEPPGQDRTPDARNAIGTLQIIYGDGDFDFSNNRRARLGTTWLTQEEAGAIVEATVGKEAASNLEQEIETGTVNVELVDLNGDGRLDILEAQFVWVVNNHNLSDQRTSGFKAYLNRGDCFEDATSQLFANQENNRKIKDSNPTEYIEGFFHRDVTGDGLPDLVVQSFNFRKSMYESFRTAYPYIFINQNNERYKPVKLGNVKPLLPLGEVVAGDFNGDGKVDLLALHRLRVVAFLSDKPFDPSMVPSGGRTEKYDRTREGLSMRFTCLMAALSDRGDAGVPAKGEIERVISGLEGNRHYRTKRHLVKLGLSEAVVKAQKANLLRLVNFEGTNEEFCARPLR